MTDLKVWIRVGDRDDYHSFDSIEEAAYELHDAYHGPDFENDGPCHHDAHKVDRYIGPAIEGVVLPGTPYTGNNGISFYWGDADAQFESAISDLELDAIRNTINAT